MNPNILLIFVFGVVLVQGVEEKNESSQVQPRHVNRFGRLVEEGRTLVHNSVKRLMVILPAIFFKLGVAFTMLVLVAVASVTNGFIGFMLLVVGLSSVLARLQSGTPTAAPVLSYHSPVVAYQKHYQDWDRNDKGVAEKKTTPVYYTNLNSQDYQKNGYTGANAYSSYYST